MNNMMDVIEVSLPFKAEYVSVARLTASGIASRMGFDIETIEDIKVAIAEVCNKLVNVSSKNAEVYKVVFKVFKDKLTIVFDSDDKSIKCIFDDNDSELGLSIITAFMDEVELCTSNDYILSMTKVLEGNC